jgi:hypothetical protein
MDGLEDLLRTTEKDLRLFIKIIEEMFGWKIGSVQ